MLTEHKLTNISRKKKTKTTDFTNHLGYWFILGNS